MEKKQLAIKNNAILFDIYHNSLRSVDLAEILFRNPNDIRHETLLSRFY
jgi:hypothetical protein